MLIIRIFLLFKQIFRKTSPKQKCPNNSNQSHPKWSVKRRWGLCQGTIWRVAFLPSWGADVFFGGSIGSRWCTGRQRIPMKNGWSMVVKWWLWWCCEMIVVVKCPFFYLERFGAFLLLNIESYRCLAIPNIAIISLGLSIENGHSYLLDFFGKATSSFWTRWIYLPPIIMEVENGMSPILVFFHLG